MRGNFSIDGFDYRILLHVVKQVFNEELSTVDFARLLCLSQKNFIRRMNRLEGYGWVEKKTKALEPKGWQRIFLITEKGKEAISDLENVQEVYIKNFVKPFIDKKIKAGGLLYWELRMRNLPYREKKNKT